MVADGMGGHRGGDKASKIAIEEAAHTYKTSTSAGLKPDLALEQSLKAAALRVYRTSLSDLTLKGMGTTLSALALSNDRAYIAHIGDTRIYLLRDNMLYQLTSDHSLVNEQVQAGIMTKEEARTSSLRNIITRAIGHDENVRADYFSISSKKNDIFLLCTDGLNNMLFDSEIQEIISRFEPADAVNKLIYEANQKGGDDNITVILIRLR
jgi:serine/threonine protein phosphatase PrpC